VEAKVLIIYVLILADSLTAGKSLIPHCRISDGDVRDSTICIVRWAGAEFSIFNYRSGHAATSKRGAAGHRGTDKHFISF